MTYYDAEIEYLEGTGVQYIDTEIIPTLQYSFECGFYYVSYDSVTDSSATLFGCQSTWITESFTLLVTPSKTGLYNCWGNKYTKIERSTNTTYWNTLIGVWHTLEFKNKETYIDGIKKLSAVESGTSGEPTLSIHLFNCQRNGNPTFGKGSIKRISYAKIFNENRILLMDLIPVRIGSVGYMYDKVSDRLFGNAGTGSFTLGPDVKVTAPIVGKPKVSLLRRKLLQFMPRIDYSKYAIHKNKNAAAMAVVYAQGWSASPDYMTFEEAAAVTNITNKFYNNKNLTHFEEFKYFTGVTAFSESQSNYWFRNCTNLSTIELPSSLRILGYNCFNSSGLTSIYLPDTITQINQGRSNWHAGGTFENCTKLKTVRYTNGVNYIRSHCFYGCTRLKEITNIDNVTVIGGDAFRNCSSLITFTIPSGVTSIGSSNASATGSYTGYTFNGCTSLTNIICLPTTPPTLTGTNNFPTTCVISVPSESLNAYKTATGWSDIAEQIVSIS